MSVNKVNIRRWIEDLRTTDAPQVKGRLSNGVGYCCLGRACEVARQDGIVTVTETGDGMFYVSTSDPGDRSTGTLPGAVAEWLGIDEYDQADPDLAESDDDTEDMITATLANDHLKWSFERIADALERRYLS